MSWPDHTSVIQDFINWVRDNSSTGITIEPTTEVNRSFLPLPLLKHHFVNVQRIRNLLHAIFPGQELPVDPNTVQKHYLRVFSILLLIGKGKFIQICIRHDSLCDHKLPFEVQPYGFPSSTSDSRFFQTFYNEQWKFCAHKFRPDGIELRLGNDRILPIVQKEQIQRGGSAVIYKIVVHQNYDELSIAQDSGQYSSHPCPNTYVLKSYFTQDAEKYYKSEVEAFRRLISSHTAESPMIGFFGSFSQNGTFHVVLEYADRGTLEDYFMNIREPSEGEDINKFWRSLFNIIRALMKIHEVELVGDSDRPQILQGWHQDVRPANILVKSGNSLSEYDYQFKLADLGLSHFKQKVPSQGDMTDRDTRGTRTYGAPECYRFDDFTQECPLNVRQGVDIWSLGCVFSEAAKWVVYGWHGLQLYRKQRMLDTDGLMNFGGGDCFHDGQQVLQTVSTMHGKLPRDKRDSDYITQAVLIRMADEMLYTESRDRPTARHLWRKSRQILREADDKLKIASRDHRNSGKSFSSGEPPLSPSLPRTPPEVPPERSRTRPYTPSSSQVRDTWASNGEQRRNMSYIFAPERSSSPERLSSPENLHDIGDRDDQGVFNDSSPPQTNRLGGLNIRGPLEQRGSSSQNIRTLQETGRRHTESQSGGPLPNAALLSRSSSNHVGQRGGKQVSFDSSLSQDHIDRTQSLRQPTRTSTSSLSQPQLRDADILPHGLNRQASASPPSSIAPTLPLRRISEAPQKLSNRQKPPKLSVAKALQWKMDKKGKVQPNILTDEYLLRSLSQRDHVFIIDDSLSMRSHWEHICTLFGLLAYMVKGLDPDGIELYFTIHDKKYKSRNSTKLLHALKCRDFVGSSDIKLRLGTILQAYQLKLHNQARPKSFFNLTPTSERVNPLNVYIFTDGVWQPMCDTDQQIKYLVDTLCDLGLPETQVGIQFIRFGNDKKGIKRLKHLDNGLPDGNGKKLRRDIVDHEPADGNVWKMLLGAVNKWFDEDEDDDDDENETEKNDEVLYAKDYAQR